MRQANQVLELLYDRAEAYVAPDELAEQAGLDREGLQRALEHLRQRGHRLAISPVGGVRLDAPICLDAHLIQRGLNTKRIGRNVICFQEVDSTNDVAFDSASQVNADGLVVLAEFQRRGRGRLGRNWLSPSHANVLLSALLIDPSGLLPHEALTVAAGLAVAEAIQAACGLDGRLRWPNDVLLADKKTAGILVELRDSAVGRAVVIGVGVNVNACPPQGQIGRAATCIAEQLGHSVSRIEIAQEVLRRLDGWVRCIASGSLDELKTAWLSRCDMIQQRIGAVYAGRRYDGRVLDVGPLEGLVLECDDGQRLHLPARSATVLD